MPLRLILLTAFQVLTLALWRNSTLLSVSPVLLPAPLVSLRDDCAILALWCLLYGRCLLRWPARLFRSL